MVYYFYNVHCLVYFKCFKRCIITSNTNIDVLILDHISTLCTKERNLPMYKKIDGTVLTSEGEDNLECIITFQTDTILQRFMLRFERLALDCNDHLYIFDGAHAFGSYKVK